MENDARVCQKPGRIHIPTGSFLDRTASVTVTEEVINDYVLNVECSNGDTFS